MSVGFIKKKNVPLCLCMSWNAGRGGGISLPTFCTLALDGGNWSDSYPGRFTSMKDSACLEEERNLLVLPVIELRFLWCTDLILLMTMTVASVVKYKKLSRIYKSKNALVFLGTYYFHEIRYFEEATNITTLKLNVSQPTRLTKRSIFIFVFWRCL